MSIALWEVDEPLINKIVDSMINKPFISGIKLYEEDKLKLQIGVTSVGNIQSEQEKLFQKFYSYEFPINYDDDGKTHYLGHGNLFYSSAFIYEQVKFTLEHQINRLFLMKIK